MGPNLGPFLGLGPKFGHPNFGTQIWNPNLGPDFGPGPKFGVRAIDVDVDVGVGVGVDV